MGLSNSNPPTAQVKLLVSPKSGRVPWSLLSWLALGSGAAFLVLVILSGARLIIDPYSPNWLKTAFPGLVNTFETVPQTTAEIRAEMKSQGIVSGQPLPWPNTNQPQAWFYPIFSTDGKSVEALWVYRVRGAQLQKVEQVSIRPLKESFVTTPLVGTASQVASVDSDVSLSSVNLMSSQSLDSPWILLEGKRRYGNTVMRYGQVLSYQAHSQRVHRLLNWSSPADQPPTWQSSETGSQLVIDQTVGLRPSFLLYQLVPNDPPQLQEISLYRSVYESDLGTSLYDKALKLAQGAVWSHSLQMMQSAKAALAHEWSTAAQTQLDLIRLHAERTKRQTAQTWSSQQQHVLAYLIDGQWEKALDLLEANPAIYEATLKRLERDFDALWRAVTTHLQVHPQDEPTQVWGALLVTARQTPKAGEDWLTKKTRSQTTLKRFQSVDSRLAQNNVSPDFSSVSLVDDLSTATAPTGDGRYQGLIGQVSTLRTPGGGWLRSQTLPTPAADQTWYQITLQWLQDSSGWGLPPVSITPTAFWSESLALRRQMQLFRGNTAVAGVTVHGVKQMGSSLVLLAMGPRVDGPLLATTANSLRWMTALPWQPMPMVPTASDTSNELPIDTNDGENDVETLVQIETLNTPAALMAETIGRQLGLDSQQTAQLYPYLQHATVDLVGDLSTEHIVSLGPEVPSELALIPGKTLIFSTTGDLLYSDIDQPHSLLAFTAKYPNQPVTLLIEQAGRYSFIGL